MGKKLFDYVIGNPTPSHSFGTSPDACIRRLWPPNTRRGGFSKRPSAAHSAGRWSAVPFLTEAESARN